MEDLKQGIIKGINNCPRNVASSYDMLTHFELEARRHQKNRRTGDRGNRNNYGGHGGQDHMFIKHNLPSGTVFTLGIENFKSYHIKCLILKSGAIMKTNSQRQQEITLQTNQDETWHR